MASNMRLVVAATMALATVGPLLAAEPVDSKPPVQQTDLTCDGVTDTAAATAQVVAQLRAALAALPADQQSSADMEAAILFTLSQNNWCPTVITAALRDLRGSDGGEPVHGAVMQVLVSLQRNGGVGTAGFNTPGLFVSSLGTNSFFTGPLVGVGGGTATYAE